MTFRSGPNDIAENALLLGFTLSPSEVTSMQSAVNERLIALQAFAELDIDEHRPALWHEDRGPVRKPTRNEDPLNAFISMCHVIGENVGLLAGKSVGVKDNTSVAGVPMSLGLRLMDGFIPDMDATIVSRVLRAGGKIVGKTNMHLPTEAGDYGRVLNPHNHAHVAGGSSSGSAAAVASGYLDIGFGGDQGGSIRTTSSWCGVLGLMPTWGLVPHTGVFGYDPSIDHVGPIARTTQDIAAALESVAGPDGFDARQCGVTPMQPRYTGMLDRGINGLTIGILSEGFGREGSEADVEQTVLGALSVLEAAGGRLEKVSAPLHDKAVLVRRVLFTEGYKRLYDTNMAGSFMKAYYPTSLIAAFGRAKKAGADRLPYYEKLNLLIGTHLERQHHGVMYAKAQNVRPTFAREYDKLFSHVDLIAMPTVPIKAPRYSETEDRTAHDEGERMIDLEIIVRNTCPFNLTGHPAINIPCGTSQGLPIGLMLIAPRFREDILLRAAYVYQHSVDWWSQFPAEVRQTSEARRP